MVEECSVNGEYRLRGPKLYACNLVVAITFFSGDNVPKVEESLNEL